jgi:tetratricopeptide (TPR) repeat protein
MNRFDHFLRALTVLLTILSLYSISHAVQSWEADKKAPWVGNVVNGPKCDGGQIPYGPYDYRLRDQFSAELQIVEDNHFDADVESLTNGISSTPLDDIHYTLQAWPNHHRALNTAVRYRLQNKGKWSFEALGHQGGYPAECYLQRAINFSPKDPIPYMLHGLLMHKMKEFAKALESYRVATQLLPNDIITQYNMGLTLVALKKYKEAKQVADRVYSTSFPLPGLKNKLIAAGHWNANSNVAASAAKASENIAKDGAVPEADVKLETSTESSGHERATSKPEVPVLTEEQLEEVRKAMLEKAARKKASTE